MVKVQSKKQTATFFVKKVRAKKFHYAELQGERLIDFAGY
jgi:hypothetical protein